MNARDQFYRAYEAWICCRTARRISFETVYGDNHQRDGARISESHAVFIMIAVAQTRRSLEAESEPISWMHTPMPCTT